MAHPPRLPARHVSLASRQADCWPQPCVRQKRFQKLGGHAARYRHVEVRRRCYGYYCYYCDHGYYYDYYGCYGHTFIT